MSLTSYILNNNVIDNLQVACSTTAPTHQIVFTNNVVQTNVLSNSNRDGLVAARLGTNIQVIDTSCFIGQSSLQRVEGASSRLKDVRDYAFKDCTQLTSVSFLTPGKTHPLENIGISAFANTGLLSVAVNLSGSSVATQVNSYAFAGCKQLKHFENVAGNYLADHEFDGCTSLTSICMPERHSFSGRYAFKDCSSLQEVTIPANTYAVNEGVFMGCSSLTSIAFKEPSLLTYVGCIGNNFLNGTAITSLTFPASITSYAQLDDYALANMPYLKELHFNGMTSSDIAEVTKDETLKYETGIIYTSIEKTKSYGVFRKKSKFYNANYKWGNYFKKVSEKQCKDIQSYCVQNKIPIVLIRGQYDDSNCSHCNDNYELIFCRTEFLDWLKSELNNCIVVHTAWDVVALPNPHYDLLPYFDLYWKEPSGTTHYVKVNEPRSHYGNTAALLKDIKKTFKNYTGSTTHIQIINTDIMESHCFGLNHSVLIYGKDNKKAIKYEDDGSGSVPQIIYEQSILVDRLTVDDFRYGQWYYNAKELREYADEHSLPVFLEFGSAKCGPCEDFAKKVFNSSQFQAALKAKKLLLCRLGEENNFNAGQGYYISQVWTHRNVDWPEGKMPILGFYWKKKNSMTNGYGEYIDEELRSFAHYNDANTPDTAPYCPLTHSLETVLQWLETKCFPLLETNPPYEPNPRFDRPPIVEYLTGKHRYKIYANQPNDTYGRYFPVVELEPARPGTNYTVTVRNSSNVLTEYTINDRSTTDLPPDGTYQCFTMLSTASMPSAYFESNYDISGLMFKIGSATEVDYLTSDSYGYGEMLNDSYLVEQSLTGSNIVSYMSSFNDIYLRDENDDPTTQIDPDQIDEDQPIYNVKWTYQTTNITKLDESVSKAVVYTSADVAVQTDESGDKYLSIVGDAYTMSANFYFSSESDRKVQWLSVFYNNEQFG